MAARQRSACGQRATGSASPRKISADAPGLGALEHLGRVVGEAGAAHAALVGRGGTAARRRACRPGRRAGRGRRRRRAPRGRSRSAPAARPRRRRSGGSDPGRGDTRSLAAGRGCRPRPRARAALRAARPCARADRGCRRVGHVAVARDHDQVGPSMSATRRGVRARARPSGLAACPRPTSVAPPAAARGPRPGVRLLVRLLARGDDGHRAGAVEVRVVADARRDRLGGFGTRRARDPRPAREAPGSGRRRRGGACAKRPLSHSQPSSSSGRLRERMRSTRPRARSPRCCSRSGRARTRSGCCRSPRGAP